MVLLAAYIHIPSQHPNPTCPQSNGYSMPRAADAINVSVAPMYPSVALPRTDPKATALARAPQKR